MKHLNRFNENKSELDTRYIDDCFVEFKDKGYHFKMNENDSIYSLDTYFMRLEYNIKGYDSRNINQLFSFVDEMRTNVDEIKYCIEKVKLKYPKIRYNVFLYNEDDSEVPLIHVFFKKEL